MISRFYDRKAIADAVKAGRHRESVGGLWDQIGQLQFDFLVANGLRPEHKLLDIGCGSLRGGVKFVRYLQSGHYFGTDLNGSLLGRHFRTVGAGRDAKIRRRVCNFIQTPTLMRITLDVAPDAGTARRSMGHDNTCRISRVCDRLHAFG